MPIKQFSLSELWENGVSEHEIKIYKIFDQDAYLVNPASLARPFRERLQQFGYDPQREIKAYQAPPPPNNDAWVFEQP
jgi:hypothetical protein